MNGGRVLAAVLILVLAVVALHPPPADAVTWTCDSGGGGVRYAPGSAYEASLRRVADALPTNASTSANLFATAAVAAGPNQTVYAAGLCRGDLVPDTCLVCLRSSFSDAQLQCPLDTDVSMNYDSCHMRFAGVDFLASTNNSVQLPYFSNFPAVAASAAGRFNGLVAELLAATAGYAAGSERRFATGEMDVDSGYSQGQFSNIFATAQCTPDLTPGQCRACLAGAMAEMPRQVFPRNSTGASFVGERCGLQFAPYAFYDGDTMVKLPIRAQGELHVQLPCVSCLGPDFFLET